MAFMNCRVRPENRTRYFQVCSCFSAIGTDVDLAVGGLIITREHNGKGQKRDLGELIDSEGETAMEMDTEDAAVTAKDLVRMDTCWLLWTVAQSTGGAVLEG